MTPPHRFGVEPIALPPPPLELARQVCAGSACATLTSDSPAASAPTILYITPSQRCFCQATRLRVRTTAQRWELAGRERYSGRTTGQLVSKPIPMRTVLRRHGAGYRALEPGKFRARSTETAIRCDSWEVVVCRELVFERSHRWSTAGIAGKSFHRSYRVRS